MMARFYLLMLILLGLLLMESVSFNLSRRIEFPTRKPKPTDKISKYDRLKAFERKVDRVLSVSDLPPLPSIPALPPKRHVLSKPKDAKYDLCKVANLCQNGAQCIPFENEYTCDCSAGFYGKTCSFKVDDTHCEKHKCKNGGACYSVDTPARAMRFDEVGKPVVETVSYKCWCKPSFYGYFCDFTDEMKECTEAKCNYHGYIDINEFKKGQGCVCKCEEGYGGTYCDVISPCVDLVCQNGAEKCDFEKGECICPKLSEKTNGYTYYSKEHKGLRAFNIFDAQANGISCNEGVLESAIKSIIINDQRLTGLDLDEDGMITRGGDQFCLQGCPNDLRKCLPCFSDNLSDYINCLKSFSEPLYSLTTIEGSNIKWIDKKDLENKRPLYWLDKYNALFPWFKHCDKVKDAACDYAFKKYCRSEGLIGPNSVNYTDEQSNNQTVWTGHCSAKIDKIPVSDRFTYGKDGFDEAHWKWYHWPKTMWESLLPSSKHSKYFLVPHCDCPPGRDGDWCQIPLTNNPCDFTLADYESGITRCEPMGGCVADPIFPEAYKCSCAHGYRGDRCEEHDPCYRNPCGEALCVELRPSEVEAFNDKYTCVCKLSDDVDEELKCVNPEHQTPEIKEKYQEKCLRNGVRTCLNGGHCILCEEYPLLCDDDEMNRGFRCQCLPGFHPPLCEIEPPNACTTHKCENGGTCKSTNDSKIGEEYECECPYDFTGVRCEKPVGLCSSKGFDACMHAECEMDANSARGFKCVCAPGFKGINCDLLAEYDFWSEFHKYADWTYPISLNMVLIPVFVLMKLIQECLIVRGAKKRFSQRREAHRIAKDATQTMDESADLNANTENPKEPSTSVPIPSEEPELNKDDNDRREAEATQTE